MVTLPDGWATERASGWWEIHHIVHKPCGFRSWRAFDFIHAGDCQQIRVIVAEHICQ